MGGSKVVRTVCSQGRDQEGDLFPILGGLEVACANTASVCDDRLVYGKALGARHLHKDASPIEGRRVDRFGDQDVPRQSADTKGRQVPKVPSSKAGVRNPTIWLLPPLVQRHVRPASTLGIGANFNPWGF